MEFYDLVNNVTIQSNIEVWNLDADDNEEFVFSLDNVDDLGLCFYPENFNVFCEVAFMYVNNNGKLIIEVRNAWDQMED